MQGFHDSTNAIAHSIGSYRSPELSQPSSSIGRSTPYGHFVNDGWNIRMFESTKTKRRNNQMSFAYIYATPQGLILASDTRRTFTRHSISTVEFFDNEQKIFMIGKTYVVGVLTGYCRFGENNDLRLQDILQNVNGKSLEEITDSIKNILLDTHRAGDCSLFLCQCCIENGQRIFRYAYIDMDANQLCDITIEKNPLPYGYHYVQGERWANEFAHNFCILQTDLRIITSCIRDMFARIFQATKCLPYNAQTIGGQCDMYLMDENGLVSLGKS